MKSLKYLYSWPYVTWFMFLTWISSANYPLLKGNILEMNLWDISWFLFLLSVLIGLIIECISSGINKITRSREKLVAASYHRGHDWEMSTQAYRTIHNRCYLRRVCKECGLKQQLEGLWDRKNNIARMSVYDSCWCSSDSFRRKPESSEIIYFINFMDSPRVNNLSVIDQIEAMEPPDPGIENRPIE